MPPRFIAQQLSHPAGFFGRIMGKLMNRHNAGLNAFTLRQLTIQSSDRILEIGFGGGANVPVLIKHCRFFAGVDRSSDVVRWANARFSDAVRARRAEFHHAAVEKLPFKPLSFDKVVTVNTIYFWTSLEAGFREIHRVLSPRGKILVGFLPKEHMDRGNFPADIFFARLPEEVTDSLVESGFSNIRIERPRPTIPWCLAVADR